MIDDLARIAGCHSAREAIRWMVSRRPARWPRRVEQPLAAAPPERVEGGEIRAVLIGHSTVLLQVDGWNLLLDPIWSRRCSPLPFVGPARARRAALRFEDLPPIDAVLVSHNHYDHCDAASLRRLARKHAPVTVSGRGNESLLRRFALERVHSLNWWQQLELEAKEPASPMRITYVPAQHFSGRALADRNRALWGGFVIHSTKGPLYFAGDTGYHPRLFGEIRRRYGAMRLACIPIGAYDPRWFMKPVHCDPGEAMLIHQELESEKSVAIHHATFQLTDEPMEEPAARLRAEQLMGSANVGEAASGTEFTAPAFGETIALL